MGIWTPGPRPTSGNDTYTGHETTETVSGGDGNDTLIDNDDGESLGASGRNQFYGGIGNDAIYVGRARTGSMDFVDGGEGFDRLFVTLSAEGGVGVSSVVVANSWNLGVGGNSTIEFHVRIYGYNRPFELSNIIWDPPSASAAAEDTLLAFAADPPQPTTATDTAYMPHMTPEADMWLV